MTLREVLLDCLDMVEFHQRRLSHNWTLLEPKKGCEGAWDMEREKAVILRGHIYELDAYEAEKKKGEGSRAEGEHQGAAGELGGQVDSGEPHAAAVAGAPGDIGGCGGLPAGMDAQGGVLGVEVRPVTPHQPPRAAASPQGEALGKDGVVKPLSPKEWSEIQGLPQGEKPPLNDRLNSILRRDMPEYVALGNQPPWVDAAMARAAKNEQDGQTSFI